MMFYCRANIFKYLYLLSTTADNNTFYHNTNLICVSRSMKKTEQEDASKVSLILKRKTNDDL